MTSPYWTTDFDINVMKLSAGYVAGLIGLYYLLTWGFMAVIMMMEHWPVWGHPSKDDPAGQAIELTSLQSHKVTVQSGYMPARSPGYDT
jgi:hypothetical protein